MNFYAMFKGVNLDEHDEEETKEAFARAQRRAQARLAGLSEDEVARQEEIDSFADFGLEVETDE